MYSGKIIAKSSEGSEIVQATYFWDQCLIFGMEYSVFVGEFAENNSSYMWFSDIEEWPKKW